MQTRRSEDDKTTAAASESSAVPLTEEHCWQLLASSRVARLAFVDDGLPQLVVMNHLPQEHELLFQTNEDSRLAVRTAGDQSIPVAAEVDSASAAGKTGWSVIATGPLSRTTIADVERAPLPWRPEAVGCVAADDRRPDRRSPRRHRQLTRPADPHRRQHVGFAVRRRTHHGAPRPANRGIGT